MRAPRLSIGLGSLLVALALVVAVGIGSAIAVIPNQGTYHACLTKSTGAIKVINYPKVKCAKGTQLIKWSQQGPAGPQGPQGAQGPAGASGSSNWGDIANKPADLADGQIGWGEVKNIPAGFADGVDNGAFVSSIVETNTFASNVSWTEYDIGPFSPNADVDINVIPTTEGKVTPTPSYVWRSGSNVFYRLRVTNTNLAAVSYKVRARVYSEGITAAALRQQLKHVKVINRKVKRSE
jgi:hypothetical protein